MPLGTRESELLNYHTGRRIDKPALSGIVAASRQCESSRNCPMPLPEFTPDEEHAIAYVKSATYAEQTWHMWSYIFGGITLCGFGAYHDDVPMMVVAIVIVCGFRIYEERQQSRFLPIWRSIIDKYERADNSN